MGQERKAKQDLVPSYLTMSKNVVIKAAGARSGMINTSQQTKNKEWKTRLNPNANLIAGGFGGLCSLAVGYPFDTVKVRLQTSANSKTTYKSAFDCLKKIVIHEGAFNLFRGISGLACVALPRFALMFHSNTVARNYLMDNEDSKHYFHIMLSGALSQVLVVPLIVAPLERIKVIMQTDPKVQGQWSCFKQIMRTEGPRGVFKGTLITYARDMPSFATYFLVYDFLRQNISSQESSILRTILSGALAGIAGWMVAIPADVVKNRHQASDQSKSAFTSALHLLKTCGVRGFFLGAGPILLRAGPASAAAFLGYEAAIKFVAYVN